MPHTHTSRTLYTSMIYYAATLVFKIECILSFGISKLGFFSNASHNETTLMCCDEAKQRKYIIFIVSETKFKEKIQGGNQIQKYS